MPRKICVVITARPSYNRIKSALTAIQKHDDLELQLVVCGSALLDRYGTVAKFIEADGFNSITNVYTLLEGENLISMAKTTGVALMELSSVFYNLEPDVIVTVADRYETIATAIAAAYLNIPLAHVQGGEVTGSIDEKVRHAVTKLADLHFVSTQKAAERVIRMGEDPAKVFVTGCPSIDLAAEILDSPDFDFDPVGKYGGVGDSLDVSNGYLVVMQHPVTTEHDMSRYHVSQTLRAVEDAGLPTLWFWPNADAGSDGTSKGLRSAREEESPSNIRFFKNMAPNDFLRLLYNSRCLVGNSSVGIRECSFLGVPVVNIGSRQQGRETGSNTLDVDYESDQIFDAIHRQLSNGRYPQNHLYGDGRAGKRIADLLCSAPLSVEKKLAY